jgi:hypothetical protein
MRRIVTAALLAASIACSTTGSIGQSRTFGADKGMLWFALQDAITAMGGRITLANESMGTVVGRFTVEGTPVELNVQAKGSPSPDAGRFDFFDVSAAASLVGDRDPDEDWRRQLRWFEEEYMRVLESSLGTAGSRRP